MKKIIFGVFIISITIFNINCSNSMYSMSYSPINETYSEELYQIQLGMTKQEVKAILPDIRKGGQTYVSDEVVEAQKLQHNYWSGVGGYLINDYLWFIFIKTDLSSGESQMIGPKRQI